MRARGRYPLQRDDGSFRRSKKCGPTGVAALLSVSLLCTACQDTPSTFAFESRSASPSASPAVMHDACLATDYERVRRSLAAAHATVLSVTSTISDELVSTGALPPADQYGNGNLDPNNPVLRVAYDQLRGAREEAESLVSEVDGCQLAGTLTEPRLQATSRLLLGIALLLIAESFEDFEISPLTGPVGAANMHQLYDMAVTSFSEALTFASSLGDTGLEREATALRARAAFGHALWTARHGPTPSSPLVQSPGAVADAHSALSSPLAAWEYALTAPFALWPDLIPSESYATLTDAGTPNANLLDPITSLPAPTLQARVTDLLDNIHDPKALPLATTEMLMLIVAEWELFNADIEGFTTRINQLRALHGLPAHPTPSDVAEGIELLRHHRRADLFLQGSRLADQLRFGTSTPEWSTTPAGLLPIPTASSGTADRILITGQVGPLPSVTLVDGRAAWGCLDDRTTFSTNGVAELLVDAPVNMLSPERCRSEASIFSHRNRFVLEPNMTAWTAGTGDAPTAALDAPYDLHLWIRGPLSEESRAEMDVELANSILALSRAGIRLTMTYQVDATLPSKVCRCPSDPAYTTSSGTCDWHPPYSPPVTGGLLNVYYVDETVWDSTTDEPKPATLGFHCDGTATQPESLIFVSTTESVGNTLAHEVGHTLSLEHVRPIDGVLETNLMTTHHMSETAMSEARDHLTLGQVFKANVNASSWLNHSNAFSGSVLSTLVRDEPTRTRPCACDPHAWSACLPVDLDLSGPPDHTHDRFWPTPVCNDKIVHETPSEWSSTDPEDWAVILFDGRRQEDGCVDDAVVPVFRQGGLDGTAFVFFIGNLVDPSSCPSSEYFVFSRYHGMLHGDLTSAMTWTASPMEELDLTAYPGLIVAPDTIDVTYRRVGATTVAEANQAVEVLQSAFDISRLGVVFAPGSIAALSTLPGLPTPDPCSPAAGTQFTPGQLNVYFVDVLPPAASAGASGHVCGPDGNIVYVLPPSAGASVTELAHQVGHAFGLEDLGPGDLAPRDLLPNLMRHPTDGDGDLRERLTVGQVFRAYWLATSWLNDVAGLTTSRCATAADASCPYLGTDTRRD